MTNVSIRISTTSSEPSRPATGLAGAFGGRILGPSEDTTVEVAIEDLATMGDAVVAIEGALPAVASAFTQAIQGVPTEHELTGDADAESDDKPVETDVLDDLDVEHDTNPLIRAAAESERAYTHPTAAINERAEKKRRKAQRKRIREIIYEKYGREETTFEQDVKDIAKALEAEGIIR